MKRNREIVCNAENFAEPCGFHLDGPSQPEKPPQKWWKDARLLDGAAAKIHFWKDFLEVVRSPKND